MNRTVHDLLNQMNRKDLITRMAFQCAPVIAGVKVSNLLTIPSIHDEQVGEILAGTGLSCRKLAEDRGRSIFLLYREKELAGWIQDRNNQTILAEAGMEGLGLDSVLDKLSDRCRAYVQEGSNYPHEIGVLLGYPPEDVKGFVVNKGRNCLTCGYWKVYGDPESARKRFKVFDLAREKVLSCLSEGMPLRTLIFGVEEELKSVHAA